MLKVVLLSVMFVSLCDTLCEDKFFYTDCSSVHDLRKLKQQQNWEFIEIKSEENQRINGLTFMKTPNVGVILFRKAVSDIEEFTFYDLSSLKHLNFVDCDLQIIKKNWFSDLFSITYLGIDRSNVQTLEPGCLEGSSNLKRVFIEGNNISTIVGNVFSGTSIVDLILRKNQIQFIEDNAFINMPRLKYLNLSNNLLKSFAPKVILPNLQRLYLFSNQMEMIPSGALNGFSNLYRLDLSCNKLESFPESAFPFTGLPSLRKLYLRNNRLNYLPRSFMRYIPNLEYIDIFMNPWQCGCYKDIINSILLHNVTILDAQQYLNGRTPVCVVPQTGGDMCLETIQNTNNLSEYFFTSISNQSFLCKYKC